MMPLNAQILETAATWYVDLKAAAQDDPIHARHQQWLKDDPLHRQAWKRIEKLQKTFNTVPGDISASTFEQARHARRTMIKMLTVLLVVGTSGLGLTQRKSILGLMADYRTGIGEQQDIVLADGSRLQMNTDTAVNVDFDASGRILRLRHGEMLVTTAADEREFVVHTRQGQVRALGTRFQVRSDERETRVMVYEHAVEITPKHGTEHVVTVQAGQQIRFDRERHDSISSVPANTDSWTQGMLVVSDWPLSRFIDELKRYHRGKLSCDETVASLRLSGSFHLDDTHAVLKNLTMILPIKVQYFTRLWASVEPA